MYFKSNQQKKISNFYTSNGFVIIQNFFDNKKIVKIKKEVTKDLYKNENEYFYYEKIKKNSKLIRRIEKISDISHQSKELINSIKIKKLLKNIFNENFTLFKDKLNFKYPKGEGYLPHIDGHFFWKDNKSKIQNGWLKYAKNFINLVIPLERSDESNGCLYVADKKNTNILGNSWKKITKKLEFNSPNIMKKDINKFNFIPIIMNAGDLLLFNWKCAHFSKKNNSNKSRMIFYATYCEEKNKIKNDNVRNIYYLDKKYSKNDKLKKSLQY